MKRALVIGLAVVVVAAAFVAGRYSLPARGGQSARRVLYYVDPMHPSYHSERPGTAPDCGMELQPVYDGAEEASPQNPPGSVVINAEKQRLVGLQVEAVEKNSGSRALRTTGRVEPDDNRIYRLTAGTEGWVQSLEKNPAGAIVKKDDLLATFYSREFRNAQQAYLGSLATLDRLRGSHELDETSRGSDASLKLNEEQLRSLGMGEPQIKALAKSREITHDIALTSPVDGVVLSRDLSPGQRFDRGMEFYRIADLTRVWIIADILEDEAQWFRPGAKVQASVRELGKTLYATVGTTPPLFDQTSRTLRLRLEAENPRLELRPGMFVDLEFTAPAPAGLSVPEEAVLDSGLQKLVYRKTSDGVFEPVPVQIGVAYANRVVITKGLNEGDLVVTSGNFLVDSESRMHASPPVHIANTGAGVGPTQDLATSPRDPVCGMILDQKGAHVRQYKEQFQGSTYNFCSDKCREKFHHDPSRYLDDALSSTARSSEAISTLAN